jgi:hypothetical protein
VWGCLGGLFGLDSVRRKFGPLPPPEWDSALHVLSDMQVQHGLSTLLKSGKTYVPTLPEFIGHCRSAREFVNPVSPAQQIEDNRFDKWDIAGNQHFLAEVLRRMHWQKPFTAAETIVYVRWKNAWARDCREEEVGDKGVSIEKQKLWWADVMERARTESEAEAVTA